MSEKFNLKWNNFQANVSTSFQEIRKSQSLLDVTLVTDDLKEVKAHRLLLTVCSDFFKTILSDSKPEPIIYLPGFHSTNMSLILDYIYNGEVQIYQDQLDSFLESAQKLKIQGLVFDNDENETEEYIENSCINNSFKPKIENLHPQEISTNTTFQLKCSPLKVVSVTNNFDLIEKRKELISRDESGTYTCIPCGKTGKDARNMNKHVEIHMEGLQYNCQLCDKVFRNKNMLYLHNKTHKITKQNC